MESRRRCVRLVAYRRREAICGSLNDVVISAPHRGILGVMFALMTLTAAPPEDAVELGYNLTPHFSLDLGTGYSLINGWRGSVRPRFNLLESRWTPFFGLAANFNPQSGGFTEGLGAFTGPSATTHPSIFLTPTVGMTFQGYNGFFFLAGLGYAVQVAGQRPTGSMELINRANSPVGNGIAADLAIGFAF